MEPKDLIGLGDDPALEFLNTTAEQGGVKLELIGDGQAFLGWLEATGMIDAEDRSTIAAAISPAQLDHAASEAVRLREWLRPVIREWSQATEAAPPKQAIDRLNRMMVQASLFTELRDGERGLQLVQRNRWATPTELLAALARTAATLLTAGESSLVRQCEGCTMWFYDHTKGHRRRWCSQAFCGNRAKARAFRERRAAAKG